MICSSRPLIFGTNIPIAKFQTGMASLCHAIADELRSINEKQAFTVAQQNLGDRAHLGLSLYIARLIVEAHRGEVAVTSDERTGATFTIQLPPA